MSDTNYGGRLNLDELLNRNGPSAQDILDMNTVSQAIIEAEGDLALVAERLLGNKNLQDQVLSLVSADRGALDGFAAKTRAFALIKTMSIFSALGYHVMMTLPELKPEESIKAFIKVADVMERMTKQAQAASQTQVNVFETIMGQVPAPVAEALKEVIKMQPKQLEQAQVTPTPEQVNAYVPEETV